MKKNQARISYTASFMGQEGYLIETNNGNGYEVESFYTLVKRQTDKPEDSNYLHFSILNKIHLLIALGYTITFI